MPGEHWKYDFRGIALSSVFKIRQFALSYWEWLIEMEYINKNNYLHAYPRPY